MSTMDKDGKKDHPLGAAAEGKQVEYPVSYELRTVFDSTHNAAINKRNLELVLEDAKVSYTFIKSKPSSKGNYVSITMRVTLEDEKQMKVLYERLKLLPGIKFAV